MTDTIEDPTIRGMRLAHEALEQIIFHEERRRTTYVAPKYPADMSRLNDFLDSLLK